jgi:hypothetical protein
MINSPESAAGVARVLPSVVVADVAATTSGAGSNGGGIPSGSN